LDRGAEFVREALGVTPQVGGEHPRMGTHNLLLRLGDSLFLEVIAPNPAAQAPARPRWFALDTLLPGAAPALSAWVVRTSDINGSAFASSEDLGEIEPMSRGNLSWFITIPADGSPALSGVAPALIQWDTQAHIAGHLQEWGLSLAHLELFHPDKDRISRLLRSIGFEGPVSVSLPKKGCAAPLAARINTPQGPRVL
jgi:hypothetical protein